MRFIDVSTKEEEDEDIFGNRVVFPIRSAVVVSGTVSISIVMVAFFGCQGAPAEPFGRSVALYFFGSPDHHQGYYSTITSHTLQVLSTHLGKRSLTAF
jgi:hypothetical protein